MKILNKVSLGHFLTILSILFATILGVCTIRQEAEKERRTYKKEAEREKRRYTTELINNIYTEASLNDAQTFMTGLINRKIKIPGYLDSIEFNIDQKVITLLDYYDMLSYACLKGKIAPRTPQLGHFG